jgi:soluble cytochrome b562
MHVSSFKAIADLTSSRFLDMALVCEFHGDMKMAALTATKAVQTKKECQGNDFPEFTKYVDVLQRIKAKLGQQC